MTWSRLALRGLPWTPCEPVTGASARERASLTGLKGLTVLVSGIDDSDEPAPVTRRGLQVEVETRLQEAGIRVLDPEDWLQAPGRPTLHLAVRLLRHDVGVVVVVASLDLAQDVRLEADPSRRTTAITWRAQRGPGLVGAYGLAALRHEALALVDRFVADFLAVNRDAALPAGPGPEGPPASR